MAGMVSPPSPTLVSPPSQGRRLIHQVYTAHIATLATLGETMPDRGSGGLKLTKRIFRHEGTKTRRREKQSHFDRLRSDPFVSS